MRKFKAFNKHILKTGLLSLLILFAILLLLPEGYASFASDDLITDFFIFVTITCNPIGIVVSLFVITIILIFSTRRFLKLHHSLFIFLFIGIGLGSMGYYMINYLKDSFPEPRPYYEYLSEQKLLSQDLDTFTKLTPLERKKLYSEDSVLAKTPLGVNPRIYKLWLSETALSFPSGHAFNSFFLGIIYSCLLFFTLEKKYRLLYLAPLIWMSLVCLSRVILGLHHREDVVFGASLGFAAALIFIYAGALNKIIFLNRTPNAS